jgi:hypothetical protein
VNKQSNKTIMARTKKFVLPSGVGITVRSLKGKDQGTLTNQSNTNPNDAINEMLASCIIQLGDVTNVTVNDVEKMLTNDRKYALVELRQFSLRYMEVFSFTYDWAITGGKKQSQEFDVTFNRDSFSIIPYVWVSDHIKTLDKEEQELLLSEKTFYPEMYESYDEMLNEQKQRVFKTDEGEVIVWQVCDGLQEAIFSKVSKSLMDANLHIKMRKPKVAINGVISNAIVDWNYKEAEIFDTENFRREMRKTEGLIDTMLTIKNDENPNLESRVDLISTIDFFFPSQAI